MDILHTSGRFGSLKEDTQSTKSYKKRVAGYIILKNTSCFSTFHSYGLPVGILEDLRLFLD